MVRKSTEITLLYEIQRFNYHLITERLIIKEIQHLQETLIWFQQRVNEKFMRMRGLDTVLI